MSTTYCTPTSNSHRHGKSALLLQSDWYYERDQGSPFIDSVIRSRGWTYSFKAPKCIRTFVCTVSCVCTLCDSMQIAFALTHAAILPTLKRNVGCGSKFLGMASRMINRAITRIFTPSLVARSAKGYYASCEYLCRAWEDWL